MDLLMGSAAKTMLTRNAKNVIRAASSIAGKLGHGYIGSEHLLVGLSQGRDFAGNLLTSYGATPERVYGAIEKLVGTTKCSSLHKVPSSNFQKILNFAMCSAICQCEARVNTVHILLGLVQVRRGVAVRMLHECDIDERQLYDKILEKL